MSERTGQRSVAGLSGSELPARAREADDSERSLGRGIAIGLPLVGIACATIAGFVASFGTALLVLAASALVGTIALLWASVRTLSGDAPLALSFETLAGSRRGAIDRLGEQKRRVLRSLKDLEGEHALGKIDDADYGVFVTRYRAEAKDVMREMDLEVGPARVEAERLAREFLQRRGLPPAKPAGTEPPVIPGRSVCGACRVSNELDAAFCKACGASVAKPPGGADGTH